MIKLVCINNSFQSHYFTRRWELLAEQHPDVDVTLLTPEKAEWYASKSYSYGKSVIMTGRNEEKGTNYRIRTYKTNTYFKFFMESPDIAQMLRDLQPDVIYQIGWPFPLFIHLQKIVKKYLPATKLIVFSMRGPAHSIQRYRELIKGSKRITDFLKYSMFYFNIKRQARVLNNTVSAVFCHYPDAVRLFREEGYPGPIYMQTQVGVNTEWFHPDEAARKEIREKYNLGDAFVFGSASRFNSSKGIDDIIEALPKEGNWRYLMMGAGSEADESRLEQHIKERGIEGKVIKTGFVDWYEITKYWNAIDCAIHVPRTTPVWLETFSLSIVQPMVTGKPIIGNTSGSVPYQIGNKEMVVPEGDIHALNEKIRWILNNQKEAKKIGMEMKEYAEKSFSIQHLDDLFYATLLDVISGVYDEKKSDMTKWSKQ